jgi:hypothetical protein
VVGGKLKIPKTQEDTFRTLCDRKKREATKSISETETISIEGLKLGEYPLTFFSSISK